jgi:hypothetical protein
MVEENVPITGLRNEFRWKKWRDIKVSYETDKEKKIDGKG